MSQSRQLVAIMFTDIVGYTTLRGNDEKNAFELLNKSRLIQKPIIEQFNGRWIKEAAKYFQLGIGIHLEDVVFENDDVFGDGVNIASRIQAIAKPGCIYVSKSVRNNVSDKKDIPTKFVKEVILKNVKEPVRIYEIPVEILGIFQDNNSSYQVFALIVYAFHFRQSRFCNQSQPPNRFPS